MAISPSKPSEQLGALLEVPHWEDFPSPLQGCPRKDSSATAVHFWVMPTYHAEYNRLLLSEKES